MTTCQLDPSDAAAIGSLMNAWAEAYEQGDATAIAAVYAPDADVVLINGQRVAGRDGIEAMYRAAFERLPGNKTKVISETRQVLGNDLVIDDGTWAVIGVLPEGAPASGRSTTILKRYDEQWLIQCVRTMVPVARTALD